MLRLLQPMAAGLRANHLLFALSAAALRHCNRAEVWPLFEPSFIRRARVVPVRALEIDE